jgi:UDP-N-acetylmuramate dehydrogenase
LIEAAGLKGKRIGNAQISEVHANFIVNHGNAHSDDVIALIRLAQQSVFEKFAINLEPEVRILENMQ